MTANVNDESPNCVKCGKLVGAVNAWFSESVNVDTLYDIAAMKDKITTVTSAVMSPCGCLLSESEFKEFIRLWVKDRRVLGKFVAMRN